MCLARELHTHVSSMPYFLWNIQFVSNLPMEALFSRHWSLQLVVCTYTVALSRHRDCRSNQGKLSTLTSCQHNLSAFFVFFPVQVDLNISLEHLFPPISIYDFQKKKELRNSRLCVWRPQDCKTLGRVEHYFDLTKPGV